MMPFWVVRAIVGVMCVGFAHMAGRSLVRRSGRRRRGTGPLSWTVRAVLAALALSWRGGLDYLTVGFLALSILAAAGGYFLALRPQPEEDLARKMFPHE